MRRPIAATVIVFGALICIAPRAWPSTEGAELDCRTELITEFSGDSSISPAQASALISSALTARSGLACSVYNQMTIEAQRSFESYVSIENPVRPRAVASARAGDLMSARNSYLGQVRSSNPEAISELDEHAALAAAMSDFAGAAALYAEAARLEQDIRQRQAFEIEEAEALHLKGSFYRDSDALARATEIYRRLSLSIDRTDSRWPWLQASLANAVFSQADRTADTETKLDLLENAVALYRSVAQLQQSMPTPEDWAGTQYNLGLALTRIGVRHPHDQALLELQEANGALRSALALYSPEHYPSLWSTTKIGIAEVLMTRSLFEGQAAARTDLEQASTHLRDVLAVRPRSRAPLDWASAQGALALVYDFSARIEQDSEHKAVLLRQSISADRACLEIITMANDATTWAAVQQHLGETLLALIATGSAPSLAHESITAIESAQRVIARNADPDVWGKLSIDLAMAHAVLAEPGDRTHMPLALESANAALAAFEAAHDDSNAALARQVIEVLQHR